MDAFISSDLISTHGEAEGDGEADGLGLAESLGFGLFVGEALFVTVTELSLLLDSR